MTEATRRRRKKQRKGRTAEAKTANKEGFSFFSLSLGVFAQCFDPSYRPLSYRTSQQQQQCGECAVLCCCFPLFIADHTDCWLPWLDLTFRGIFRCIINFSKGTQHSARSHRDCTDWAELTGAIVSSLSIFLSLNVSHVSQSGEREKSAL